MAKRSSAPKEIYVDPKEPTPEGVINVKRREPPPGGAPSMAPNVAPEVGGTQAPNYIGSTDPYAEGSYQEPGGVPNMGPLQPPTTWKLISQTVRQGPDGKAVVDVVFEVNDVIGATNYEVRVTKVVTT